MSQDTLFDGSGVINPNLRGPRGMVRPTDLQPAHEAARDAKQHNEANRRLILRLLVQHEWLTQFCPLVLMPQVWNKDANRWERDQRFKQTAIGPRYASLTREGLIELIEKRTPRVGAESHRPVSTYRITQAGRLYLARCDAEPSAA